MTLKKYSFDVETLESGQRQRYGDSFYSYKITSDLPESMVKSFAMNVLRKSYKSDEMPNPFCGKLISFEKDKESQNVYIYKLTELYTD